MPYKLLFEYVPILQLVVLALAAVIAFDIIWRTKGSLVYVGYAFLATVLLKGLKAIISATAGGGGKEIWQYVYVGIDFAAAVSLCGAIFLLYRLIIKLSSRTS
ncbi:MAG: hypothetical protein JNK33_00960 [Candidatus Doudnabacteria bacterium]|nr:hypothetical protein [Candidatus Doudnabacteria bacterium]